MKLYLEKATNNIAVSLGILYISFCLQINVYYEIVNQSQQTGTFNFGFTEVLILLISPLSFFWGVLLFSKLMLIKLQETKMNKWIILLICIFSSVIILAVISSRQPLTIEWSISILTVLILVYSSFLTAFSII
ncbi:hypothetical protein AOC36_03855 [Erysipelothrix larvae]|uniref:Uncharacterized protein n=1 Tax=Erysipelothrix larvae TaxID=1514105 RepID=A0A109UGT1_9FIRM|nr:hypothetical protein [Erysipelothrix larvae]AMC93136.1 hypothetical protein AOC36_03855 [Erysipelothrix larvae]